jgi:hypothetical protein
LEISVHGYSTLCSRSIAVNTSRWNRVAEKLFILWKPRNKGRDRKKLKSQSPFEVMSPITLLPPPKPYLYPLQRAEQVGDKSFCCMGLCGMFKSQTITCLFYYKQKWKNKNYLFFIINYQVYITINCIKTRITKNIP